jgi:SpoVK/Ycf46/Vps4 family AAA+-type ATPase
MNNNKYTFLITAVLVGATTTIVSAAITELYFAFRKRKHGPNLQKLLDRIKSQNKKLTQHEELIATEVIFPEDIDVTFDDIGGLDHVVNNLRETVLLPLCHAAFFSRKLSPPKGVLLYGPPGCGKTLLAKAIAHEAGAIFINLHISTLMDKWFGESQKLVNAVFSLAKKVQPCIIFIDEIDSFLRERSKGDHEVTAMMKAEFMTLWDGLESSNDTSRIVVLGATNLPNSLDPAILRRMPKRFHIGSPDLNQRIRILQLLLKNTDLEPSISIQEIAECSKGYSGSDLKEMCKSAAFVPIQELIRAHKGSVQDFDFSESLELRPLSFRDFFPAQQMQLTPKGVEVNDLD